MVGSFICGKFLYSADLLINSMVELSLTEKAWASARKNIFRLEAIPEYSVPEDLVLFENWKQGQFELDEASKEYLEKLSKTKERGVKMQRVRIV